jgi:NAD(P)-dependent dehydrogenase (short-subunit alcohol dehydrogenase family)
MFGFFEGPAFDPKTIPNLNGKVIIITGANGGLGYESLIHLAPHKPSKIYLCARSQAKYDAAMKGITVAVPDATSFVHYLELDLTSLASAKAAAQRFLKENDRLDILMNNAGIMAQPPGLTKEGYEVQFGVNHMGHFLFTKQLLPILQKTAAQPGADVRIINITSNGHMMAPRSAGFIPDSVKTDMAEYSTWTRYGQSKLANILFTNQLVKRYPAITSVAIHPGGVKTNLADEFGRDRPWLAWLLWPVFLLTTTPPSVGALNQTWAAVAPVKGKEGTDGKDRGSGVKSEVEQGRYYVPVAKLGSSSGWAKDDALSEKLWEWSEKELEKQGY